MKKSYSLALVIITALFLGIAFGFLLAKHTGHTTIILAKHYLDQEDATVTVLPETLGKININTADVDELCNLPGVGETTANRIISYRNQHGLFLRIEDLLNVEGIGKSKFENFRDFISVSNGG